VRVFRWRGREKTREIDFGRKNGTVVLGVNLGLAGLAENQITSLVVTRRKGIQRITSITGIN
jgi:hypothetical protein